MTRYRANEISATYADFNAATCCVLQQPGKAEILLPGALPVQQAGNRRIYLYVRLRRQDHEDFDVSQHTAGAKTAITDNLLPSGSGA